MVTLLCRRGNDRRRRRRSASLAGKRARGFAFLAFAQCRMVLEGATTAVPAVRLVIFFRHRGHQWRRSSVGESWTASRMRSRRWIPVVVALSINKILVHPLAVHFQVVDFASEMFQINNLEKKKINKVTQESNLSQRKKSIYGLLALEWMRESDNMLLLLNCFSTR